MITMQEKIAVGLNFNNGARRLTPDWQLTTFVQTSLWLRQSGNVIRKTLEIKDPKINVQPIARGCPAIHCGCGVVGAGAL